MHRNYGMFMVQTERASLGIAAAESQLVRNQTTDDLNQMVGPS